MRKISLIPIFTTQRHYIDEEGKRIDYDNGWLATFKCFSWLGLTIYKRVSIKDEDLY